MKWRHGLILLKVNRDEQTALYSQAKAIHTSIGQTRRHVLCINKDI